MRTPLLAIAAFSTAIAAAAPSAAHDACRYPDAAHGFAIAKIVSARAEGGGTVVTVNAGANRGVPAGSTGFVLSCRDGTRHPRGEVKVESVREKTAVVRSSLPEDALEGAYLHIPISPPPASKEAKVAQIVEARPREHLIWLDGAAAQGILPGTRGHLLDADGKRAAYGEVIVREIEAHTARAELITHLPRGDELRAAYVAFDEGRACTVNDEPPRVDDPATARGDRPPPGYLFAGIASAFAGAGKMLALELDAGARDHVLPGAKGWIRGPWIGAPVGTCTFTVSRVTESRAYTTIDARACPPGSIAANAKVAVQGSTCR